MRRADRVRIVSMPASETASDRCPRAHYLVLGAILFAISVVGIFLNRKNVIILLMAIELMLLAVNLNFIAFSHYLDDLAGQVFVFFILTVAAAESAIGLAILVVLFRNLQHDQRRGSGDSLQGLKCEATTNGLDDPLLRRAARAARGRDRRGLPRLEARPRVRALGDHRSVAISFAASLAIFMQVRRRRTPQRRASTPGSSGDGWTLRDRLPDRPPDRR